MGKVILDLLGFLNIENIHCYAAEPIQVLIFMHLIIFYFLGFQTHVTANSSDVFVVFHVIVHLK